MGALEYQPPAPAKPPANLLDAAGAESALSGPWALSGAFTREEYGSIDATAPFPSLRAAEALGADRWFFAGGPADEDASAAQIVDVRALAPEIDTGSGRATLSALLGGYRADGDAASVDARFRDPSGSVLGVLALPAVTPDERARATNLMPRSAAGSVPPLTRSIEVVLRARHAGGAYNDAYFDDVGLAVSAPGAPQLPQPGGSVPGAPPQLRPFAGLSVLSPVARVDVKGRARVLVGCASATAGGCTGVLSLTAALRRGSSATRVGAAALVLAPGRRRRVGLRLSPAALRRLRAARRLRVRLYAAARDGQGVTRTTTAPLTLKPRKRPRRG